MDNGLSDCHLADIMDDPDDPSTAAIRPMCSFCGKKWPEVIRRPQSVPYDLELTLRRWKEGDCTTEQMFKRLEDSLDSGWYIVVNKVRPNLQKRKKPMYILKPGRVDWELNK